MIDSTILELSRSKHEYAQMASTIEGDPGALLFVTFFADTPEEAGAQLDRLQAAWREHGHGYHFLRAETAAEQDALTKVRKAGLGLLMAASEGAAPARRVRRGHRGRARAARRLRQGVPRDPRPPRADRRLLRPLPRRLPAHPPVRRPHRARRRRHDGRRRRRDRRAGGGVRRRQLVRARRRPRAQPVQPARVRRRALRGDARGQGAVRPRRPLQPRRDGRRRAAHHRTCATRRCRPRCRWRRTSPSARRRDARRRRPLPAHRRLPQDRPGRHVPVLHGHARGGARHPRARQRARQGAVGARPARGAGRRAAARDPRPLPRVQGVQERVPAERRHGDDEVGVPLALPGAARHAAALAAVRRDPAAQPARRRHRAALQPPGAARAARARRRASTAAARSRASPARRCCAGTASAHAARGAARRRRLPRRLVHHLHRARDRPRRDRAARGGGLERAARERRLLRALEHLQGPARPGAGDGRGDGRRGSRPRPSAACRSSAASRRAC